MVYLGLSLGSLIMLAGLFGVMTKKGFFRMVIGFSLMNTGLHTIMVSLGYLKGRTAPIIDAEMTGQSLMSVVDPVPQALVLTAIVIGFAVTALMLVYVLRMTEVTTGKGGADV